MEDLKYMVAVIGAGPAGLYAARKLAEGGARVVLFNRDIKPGGLAEYGIYYDKLKMKQGLRAQFKTILANPHIDYFGNVTVCCGGNIVVCASYIGCIIRLIIAVIIASPRVI